MSISHKAKCKSICIIAALIALFGSGCAFALEEVSVGTIVSNPRVGGREVCWKAYPGGKFVLYGPSDEGLVEVTSFAVSINVKENDYIEVTFIGSMYGNGYGSLMPMSGPVTSVAYSQLACGEGEGREPVWRPYVIKGIYRATGDGTASFIQKFWRSDFTGDSIWLSAMGGFAEIINPPINSPAP